MKNQLTLVLKEQLGSTFEIYSSTPLSGGDINAVYKLHTTDGNLCIKINSADKFPNLFETEALGLQLLAKNSSFTIPEVSHQGNLENQSYLLLSYLNAGVKTSNFWQSFGEKLADLHQQSSMHFGLDHDNYIGSLHQSNELAESWNSFYANQRLIPQAKLAFDHGLVDLKFIKAIEALSLKLDSIFPDESPALLHGDLWSGNYMTDDDGNPALIDPAVYFGHREMDLAMTKLFGGFDAQMYQVYNATYPLENKWEQRIGLCQLYPILVHVNLFGGSYVNQAKRIISDYN